MKNAFKVWKWSLGLVARSYRTVVVLAALIALWAFAAYAWLGSPAESSVLLMILSSLWAITQLLIAVAISGGILSGAVETAAVDSRSFSLRRLGTCNPKTLLNTFVFCLASSMLAFACSTVFDWINEHSIEVASFLTFHSAKPVSHVRIENVFSVVEGLLWIVFIGFLLSLLMTLLRDGWREAGKQSSKLLAGCAFRSPLLTSLLSVVVFGGPAYELATWHPLVPPGFWDYTQMIARFTSVLIVISAGVLFWSLSLARLQVPKQDSSPN
jgi:hypothetical protein